MSSQWEKNTKKNHHQKKNVHHFYCFNVFGRVLLWIFLSPDFSSAAEIFQMFFVMAKKLPGTILSKGCSPIVAMCQNLPVFSVFLVNPNWSHHQIRSVQEMDPWKKSLGVIWVCLFCNELWRLYMSNFFVACWFDFAPKKEAVEYIALTLMWKKVHKDSLLRYGKKLGGYMKIRNLNMTQWFRCEVFNNMQHNSWRLLTLFICSH